MLCNRFKLALMLSVLAFGCSSQQMVEEKAPLPQIPEYVKVPHPPGFDLADLRSIMISPMAPKDILGEFVNTCDSEFKKLTDLTTLKSEREAGATELVTADPERMHWCFYAKISKLEDLLQTDSTWSERQKKILETFSFLAPVANAFMKNYHDSRYLRWAAQYYSKVSEWVFFKKLEPTPESSVIFTTGANSNLEPWVDVQRKDAAASDSSVFQKYGISLEPSVAGAINPFDDKPSTRMPASEARSPK